jgi:urease accessory protein
MSNAFFTGVLHPLSAPAHAMALLALGLLLGRQRGRDLSLIVFTVGLIGGLAALVAAVPETEAATVLVAAAAIAGVSIASAMTLPVLVTAPLALVIGGAVGLDSPPQEISVGRAIAALIGTGIGASVLVSVVAFVAAKLSRPWQTIGVRILGSWIAASAVLVLALRFARW